MDPQKADHLADDVTRFWDGGKEIIGGAGVVVGGVALHKKFQDFRNNGKNTHITNTNPDIAPNNVGTSMSDSLSENIPNSTTKSENVKDIKGFSGKLPISRLLEKKSTPVNHLTIYGEASSEIQLL